MSDCIDDTADEIVDALYREREQIFQNLEEIRNKLESYDYLMKNLLKTDVAKDSRYQRRYNGFYQVRRSEEWRAKYYDLLECAKRNPKIDFPEVIRKLHDLTNQVEPSFSSKLVATVRPELPVYDTKVRERMRVRVPPQAMIPKDRVTKWIEEYKRMIQIAGAAVRKGKFEKLRDKFRKTFPAYDFTDTKKLDLMLWRS